MVLSEPALKVNAIIIDFFIEYVDNQIVSLL